jgi:hypothetical protein
LTTGGSFFVTTGGWSSFLTIGGSFLIAGGRCDLGVGVGWTTARAASGSAASAAVDGAANARTTSAAPTTSHRVGE